MKIRTDFVTNSSSSSFIIALHKDCTKEDIKNILENQRKEIEAGLNDWDYEEKIVEEIIDNLASDFIRYKNYGLKIDDWNVYSREYSSEDEIEDSIVYDRLNKIDTDKFKLKGCN